MYYMHLSEIRNFGDLAYYLHTHAFVVPIVASLAMAAMIALTRRSRG